MKTIKNKTIKTEMLPSRMSPPTITGGDVYQRMGNFYKKEANPGAQRQPSPIAVFTAIGRRIGMA